MDPPPYAVPTHESQANWSLSGRAPRYRTPAIRFSPYPLRPRALYRFRRASVETEATPPPYTSSSAPPQAQVATRVTFQTTIIINANASTFSLALPTNASRGVLLAAQALDSLPQHANRGEVVRAMNRLIIELAVVRQRALDAENGRGRHVVHAILVDNA